MTFIPHNWNSVCKHGLVLKVIEKTYETRIVFACPTRYTLVVGFRNDDKAIRSTFLSRYNRYEEKMLLDDVADWLGTTPLVAKNILCLK